MNNVVDGAPGALNTLNELAAALGDDSSFASTVTTSLAGKQDTLTAGNNITISNNTISATGKPLNVIGSADGVADPVTTTDVDSITFDKDAGFKVTASGKDVTVGLGSHWKTLTAVADGGSIAGAASITPSGQEDLTLQAGTNIKLTLDSTANDQKLKISADLVNSELTGVPTAPTAAAGTNTTQIATTAFVKTAVDTSVANVIDSAPGALDTLNELAAALGDDENFASTMTTALAGKQDNIADGDLTIAKTAGLQTALDNAGGVKKPTMTIPELSSGNILLNFTEPIKDLATYDKDDFIVTNNGTVLTANSISVENNKVKFTYGQTGQDWTATSSVLIIGLEYHFIGRWDEAGGDCKWWQHMDLQ